MDQRYVERRKIDPARGDRLGDGTPNDNDRVEIGPTQLAFAEWAAAGVELPHLDRKREWRWRRLVEALVARDIGGLLLFDGEDGHIERGFTPSFNALNLFTVPQPHSVSRVAPFAANRRYSITGWLRGA